MKKAFILVSLLALLVYPIMSRDYGIVYDDYTHNRHGKILLDYFDGRSQAAVQSPFPGQGHAHKPATSWSADDAEEWRYLNIFGGTFDLLCAGIEHALPSAGEYEIRHAMSAVFGVATAIFAGLIAKELAGWAAGLLALAFCLLSPRFLGHSMNNPKDIPFAAVYTFGIYQIVLLLGELPRFRLRRVAALAAGIALAIDIRIAGLLLILYLALFGGGLLLSRMTWTSDEWKGQLRRALYPMSILLLIGAAGYLGASILWPWARTRPFTAPLIAMGYLTRFDIFDSYNLFQGRWIHRWEIPWHYIPTWIWITLAPFAQIGLLASGLHLYRSWKKGARESLFSLGVLLFSIAFPIAYAIVRKSNVYDEARHFLFTVPPLLVLSALGWWELLSLRDASLRVPAMLVFALSIGQPLVWMARYHRYEPFYFSPAVGGGAGAFKSYEIDYWGSSIRYGVEWIVQHIPPGTEKNPVRVRWYYGDRTSGRYYLKRYPGFVPVETEEDSDQWDYSILLPAAAKLNQAWLDHWPPEGTVHQIMADGAPLLAVIRNWRTGKSDESRDFNELIRLSLFHYRKKHYEESMRFAQLASERNPRSAVPYNNIAAAYGALGKWKEELQFCEKALRLDPALQIARGNCELARSRLKTRKITR